MFMRCWQASAGIAVVLALTGCGGPGVKRAPLSSVPDSLDTESRLAMLEDMATVYPDDPALFFKLGNLYSDEAIPNQAISNYERALQLDPKMDKAKVNLAMLLAEFDQPDSAKMLLEEVLKSDPRNANAYTNLGVISYSEKKVDAAVKYYLKAVEMDPGHVEAHYNLGVVFAETGLLLEAVTELKKVLELDPEGETGQRARLALDRVEGAMIK